MAQKFVGVDLGAHHIKVAVVSAGLRGVSVVDAFEEPVGTIPEDEDGPDPLGMALAVALNALRRKRLLGNPLALVLPAGLFSYRVLSFPFADERRIAQAVSFEAEGQFPMPLDQLVHGHTVVPGTPPGKRALVVAARRDRVDQITEVFRQAGADVKLVTSGAVAAAQVIEPSVPPASPDAAEKGLSPTTLMVDIGHATTQLVALGAKGPLAVRTHRRGGRHLTAALARVYQLDLGEAEEAKHQDGFVPHRGYESLSADQLESGRVLAEALEPIVRDIEHTRLWLRSTYNLEVGKIVLAGGGSQLQGLDAYLGEQLDLPVEPLMPKTSVVKGADGRAWTSTAAALGAAYGAARRPLVQLHDASSEQADASWMQERMTSLIAMGVAIMAFGALDTIAQVKALEAEKLALEDELAEATLETFGVEMLNPSDIDAKLAEVEGADLSSQVPDRGALEVLAMMSETAKPSDLATAVIPDPMDPMAPGAVGPDGMPLDPSAAPAAPLDPSAPSAAPLDPSDPSAGAPGLEPVPAAVPKEAGIVVADDFVFEMIDIRELKIELRASATIASAQDRFNYKLTQLGCLTGITNGKVGTTSDNRKRFDMEMSSACYRQAKTSDDEEESEAEAEPGAEDEGAETPEAG